MTKGNQTLRDDERVQCDTCYHPLSGHAIMREGGPGQTEGALRCPVVVDGKPCPCNERWHFVGRRR